ncbi:hypothetical protein SBA2_640039 [Acidobacteriia bacterium SbA2]|nr:hypothetical protein SBA2_640039 [Acidobacteriia bacterium SbA2]
MIYRGVANPVLRNLVVRTAARNPQSKDGELRRLRWRSTQSCPPKCLRTLKIWRVAATPTQMGASEENSYVYLLRVRRLPDLGRVCCDAAVCGLRTHHRPQRGNQYRRKVSTRDRPYARILVARQTELIRNGLSAVGFGLNLNEHEEVSGSVLAQIGSLLGRLGEGQWKT